MKEDYPIKLVIYVEKQADFYTQILFEYKSACFFACYPRFTI